MPSGVRWRAIHRSTPIARTFSASPGRAPNASRLRTCCTCSSGSSSRGSETANAAWAAGADRVWVDTGTPAEHPAMTRAKIVMESDERIREHRQGGLERAIGRRSGGAAVKARQLAFAGSYRLLRRELGSLSCAIRPLDLTVVRAT